MLISIKLFGYKGFSSVLLLIFLMNIQVLAQSSSPNLEPISLLPNSPNAASFGQYIQTPVSSYTGVPEINLPLWNINIGDIQLPLSMSYHAGGIKVDQLATWVGLGWSLNVGGAITRSVRGLIDANNFSYTKINNYKTGVMSDLEMATYREDVIAGREDSEPDIYYLNMNGINCQFFQNENGQFISMPVDKGILINRIAPNGWVITDNKGIKYTFLTTEKTESVYSTGDGYFQATSAWYISKIEDPKGYIVNYLYSSEDYEFKNKVSEQVNLSTGPFYGYGCPGIEFTGLSASNHIYAPVLTHISYGKVNIAFNTSITDRMDLPGSKSLDNIELYYSGNLHKKFKFFMSYFNNTNTGTTNNRYHVYEEMDKYRLKLDSLKEESMEGILPAYKFKYIENKGFPYRLSNAQDHWGFYNGADNYDFVSYLQNGVPKGANKEINPDYSKQFTLNKIIYPTGGETNYEYEGNSVEAFGRNYSYQTFVQFYGDNSFHRPGDDKEEFIQTIELDFNEYNAGNDVTFKVNYTIEDEPNSDCSFDFFLLKDNQDPIKLLQGASYILPPQTYTLMGKISQPIRFPKYPVSYNLMLSGDVIWNNPTIDNKDAPGIRIKKITNLSGSAPSHIITFNYNTPGTEKSSGTISSEPIYRTELNKVYKEYVPASPPHPGYELRECQFIQFSSVSNYPLMNEKGGYVGYNFVSQLSGEDGINGKIETEYLSFNKYSDLNVSSEFPFKPISSQSWKRGLPLKETFFSYTSQQFQIQQQKRYEYKVVENSSVLSNGIKVGAKTRYSNDVTYPATTKNYLAEIYDIGTDGFKLVSQESEEFKNNSSVFSKTNFEYDINYFLQNKRTIVSSNQTQLIEEVEYPFDKVRNNQDPNGIYQAMLSKNMLYPLATREIKNQQNTRYFENEYNSPALGKYFLNKFNSRNYIDGQMETEVHYKRLDEYGNPLEVQKKDGINTIYIWGYDNKYLIAEIIGSSYEDVIAVVDMNNIKRESITSTELRTELNKLRNDSRTKKALTTTFTYRPLVGVESKTNYQGLSIFYEYDSFGRLSIIRDENNNILKKICYNYFDQPEDCECINLLPNWQNTQTPLRCRIYNNANTGEQEQEQKDTNPCSPSYNQTRWIVTGINLSACPLPVICDNSNCNGENKKCINGVCKTGIKVFTDSYDVGNRSYCVYHYEWSDGSWSANFTSEVPFGLRCQIN